MWFDSDYSYYKKLQVRDGNSGMWPSSKKKGKGQMRKERRMGIGR